MTSPGPQGKARDLAVELSEWLCRLTDSGTALGPALVVNAGETESFVVPAARDLLRLVAALHPAAILEAEPDRWPEVESRLARLKEAAAPPYPTWDEALLNGRRADEARERARVEAGSTREAQDAANRRAAALSHAMTLGRDHGWSDEAVLRVAASFEGFLSKGGQMSAKAAWVTEVRAEERDAILAMIDSWLAQPRTDSAYDQGWSQALRTVVRDVKQGAHHDPVLRNIQ